MAHNPHKMPSRVRQHARWRRERAALDVFHCEDGWEKLQAGYIHDETLWFKDHVIGCYPSWEAFEAAFAKFHDDGRSWVVGRPDAGVFVTVTPLEFYVERYGMRGLGAREAVREKVRVPTPVALKTVKKVEKQLKPLARELVLVGSIRRLRPETGDIEFVVLPKDLDKFSAAMKELGYAAGPKRRKFSHVIDGILVELYVAHTRDEMGALILTYTGDYLFNINLRAKAKKRGLKLDQYGIWKGKKIIFQSPNEEDFFEYLDREWREPEQRSIAARQDLEKMIRDLLRAGPPEDAEAFLRESLRKLKTERFLEAPREVEIRMLHEAQRPEPAEAMSGFSLDDEDDEDGEDPDEPGF